MRRSIEIVLIACAACGGDTTAPADGGGGDVASDAPASPWTLVATGLPNQIIQSLAIDPADSNVVYAGTVSLTTNSSGVWKTTNGGASWAASNVGIETEQVFSLAVDPSNAASLFAGVFGALYQSLDHGATWTVYDGGGAIIETNGPAIVAFAPSDASRACVGGHRGFWCTHDHGATWNGLIIAPTQPNTVSVVFAPADATSVWEDGDLFVNETGAGITAPGHAIAYDGSAIYAGLYPGDNATGVRLSTDGGKTWSDVSDGTSAFDMVRQIAVAHGSVAYAAVGAADTSSLPRPIVFGSSALWTRQGTQGTWTMDPDVPSANVIAVAPSDDRVVYVGTLDGKVFRRGP